MKQVLFSILEILPNYCIQWLYLGKEFYLKHGVSSIRLLKRKEEKLKNGEATKSKEHPKNYEIKSKYFVTSLSCWNIFWHIYPNFHFIAFSQFTDICEFINMLQNKSRFTVSTFFRHCLFFLLLWNHAGPNLD